MLFIAIQFFSGSAGGGYGNAGPRPHGGRMFLGIVLGEGVDGLPGPVEVALEEEVVGRAASRP